MNWTRHSLLFVAIGIAVVVAGCAGGATTSQNNQTTPRSPTVGPTTPHGTLGTDQPHETLNTDQPHETLSTDQPHETLSTDQPHETPASANGSVTFLNQTTNGTTVIVANATLPKNGFIVVVNDCSRCGPLVSPVRGSSPYLERGEHEGPIPISLDSPVETNRTLRAVLLFDTNGDRDPDYDGSDEVVANDTNGPVDDRAHVLVGTATETVDTTTEPDPAVTATPIRTVRVGPETTNGSATKPPNSSTPRTQPGGGCS